MIARFSRRADPHRYRGALSWPRWLFAIIHPRAYRELRRLERIGRWPF